MSSLIIVVIVFVIVVVVVVVVVLQEIKIVVSTGGQGIVELVQAYQHLRCRHWSEALERADLIPQLKGVVQHRQLYLAPELVGFQHSASATPSPCHDPCLLCTGLLQLSIDVETELEGLMGGLLCPGHPHQGQSTSRQACWEGNILFIPFSAPSAMLCLAIFQYIDSRTDHLASSFVKDEEVFRTADAGAIGNNRVRVLDSGCSLDGLLGLVSIHVSVQAKYSPSLSGICSLHGRVAGMSKGLRHRRP